MLDQLGIAAEHLFPCAAGCDHIADGEGAGDRETEAVAFAKKQPSRSALDRGATQASNCQSQWGSEIGEVADEAGPLPTAFGPGRFHGLIFAVPRGRAHSPTE